MIPVFKRRDEVLSYYDMYTNGACVIEFKGKRIECKNKNQAMKAIRKLKM